MINYNKNYPYEDNKLWFIQKLNQGCMDLLDQMPYILLCGGYDDYY